METQIEKDNRRGKGLRAAIYDIFKISRCYPFWVCGSGGGGCVLLFVFEKRRDDERDSNDCGGWPARGDDGNSAALDDSSRLAHRGRHPHQWGRTRGLCGGGGGGSTLKTNNNSKKGGLILYAALHSLRISADAWPYLRPARCSAPSPNLITVGWC